SSADTASRRSGAGSKTLTGCPVRAKTRAKATPMDPPPMTAILSGWLDARDGMVDSDIRAPHGQAATDVEGLPGGEAAAGIQQIGRRMRHVLGRAHPPDRDGVDDGPRL